MKSTKNQPPQFATRFLLWFLKAELVEEVVGDLEEKFTDQVLAQGHFRAKLNYWYQVFHYLRPFALRTNIFSNLNPFFMLRHNLKISWRTLLKNKGYSFINIGGLAIGMAVAMMLGLWVFNELSFNKHHDNYDHIAQILQHRTIGDEIQTWYNMPFPMGDELELNHKDNFTHVVKSSWTNPLTIEYKGEAYREDGDLIQAHGIELWAPEMIQGNWKALEEKNTIMISESLANKIFGSEDPMEKMIELDREYLVKVTGIYKDFPVNSSNGGVEYFASWDVYLRANPWIANLNNPWGNNSFRLLVQKDPNQSFEEVSANIKDVLLNNVTHDKGAHTSRPELFLLPMKDWYLNGRFSNGVQTGGRIQYVWLFGWIGFFVLFLACINFMNLSTARSEKRAKEVGIRKAIGSRRGQLIQQFFSESILVVLFAFLFSLSLVQLFLPWFNEIADKQIALPWQEPTFWLAGLGFTLFTGLLAGSYPALYLSSFSPINALKGGFRLGRSATLPRKILVVTQFTVSIALIVGTILVYQQIQYGQNRPLGYNNDNLAMVRMREGNIRPKYKVLEQVLQQSGVIQSMALSSAPVTNVWSTNGGLDWKGKDPNLGTDFPFTGVSHEYGKTIGWEFVEGRDFSIDLASDSTAIVVNEAAIEFMQLENPIGEVVSLGEERLTIIGVTKNMVIESPYQPIRPHYYYIPENRGNIVNFKLNPNISANQSVETIEAAIKEQIQDARFNISFIDENFSKKFESEKRIAHLSSIFALLAIFISCLGLFGLASYVAERRNKEISIRKVLGASILNLWGMLSKDFVFLVLLSFFIAVPLSYYFIDGWLSNYTYHVKISWWIFAVAGLGALFITLCTISFQTIKAAYANPIHALNQE